MLRRRVIILAAGLASLAAVTPAAAPAAVRVTDGVEYGQAETVAGQIPLRLDLYRPSATPRTPRPVVVLIHGGGFRQQSRKDAGIVRIARALAARGIVAASIDYRLLGQEPVPSPRVEPLFDALPDAPLSFAVAAAADDTLTAIDYLRRNASTLGIDARRLGLIGSSAGAITANHVAYALDDHGIRRPRVRFVGSLWGGILASPGVRQLDRGEAPLFAAHGTADTTVRIALSDRLVRRARTRGVRTEYHRLRGGRHGYAASRFFTARVAGRQTAFDRLLRFASARL